MGELIRVLVVDDHALVRRGFRMMVDCESDMEVVGEAADGDSAVTLASQLQPDVVLMDIQMPSSDGIAATRRITEDPVLAGTRVVLITTFDTDDNLTAGFEAGASGYLLKTTEPEHFLAAVRGVACGQELLSPGMGRRLLRYSSTTASGSGQFATLTARELEVVALVADGLSNTEIARALFVSEATVRTHVSRAMAKVSARDRAQLVTLAFRSGVVG